MARTPGLTLRRRELGVRLRELRQQHGLTIDEVARQLLVSTAKISRMEAGTRPVQLRDIRDLCSVYGVGDEVRASLLALARASLTQSPPQAYDDIYTTWVDLESGASSIWDYKSSVIPGLLQTERYSRAILAQTLENWSKARLERLISSRRTRQLRLEGARPVQFTSVLDEAALRRVVGGPPVMHEQIAMLVARAALKNVVIQVIPFSFGAHPAVESNFTLMRFMDQVPDIVFVEGLSGVRGVQYLEREADLVRYRDVFERLRDIALDEQESAAMLTAIAEQYGKSR